MSRKSRRRESQEITSLMETSLKQINEQFDEIEKITDVSEKILKLQKLEQDIINADHSVSNKRAGIINHRMYANPWAFFTAFPKGTTKKLLKQNPGLGDFADTVQVLKDRASEMLDKTVQNCDIDHLDEITYSPYFAKALKSCEQLQDLFNAAVIKRAALGEKSAAQQTSAPAEQAATVAPTEASETPVKSGRDYRHLKNILK